MKQSTLKSLILAVLSTSVLAACGNLSHIESDGTTDKPVWPKAKSVSFDNDMGTFPNLLSLKTVQAGMTKDQLYELLGRPHFNEGFFTREWDYLFHFHTPGQGTNDVTTCQFKVLFDSDRFARSFFWKPVDPENAICPPGNQKPSSNRYTLGADSLFAFNQAGVNAIKPEGRAELDQLAAAIQKFDRLTSVTVYGYTDRLGSEKYNLALSQQRADTVKSYLIEKGVPANVVHAQGQGEANPVTECHQGNKQALIACLAPNRRVEVAVEGSGQLPAQK